MFEAKSLLDKDQDRGGIDVLVIDVMRTGKGENTKIRQTVAGDIEITHVERVAGVKYADQPVLTGDIQNVTQSISGLYE